MGSPDTTADIIDIRTLKPHLAGEIKCVSCNHTWTGICPTEDYSEIQSIECPACGLMTGIYRYPLAPDEGQLRFVCNCGNDVFMIVKYESPLFMCIKCGFKHQSCCIMHAEEEE